MDQGDSDTAALPAADARLRRREVLRRDRRAHRRDVGNRRVRDEERNDRRHVSAADRWRPAGAAADRSGSEAVSGGDGGDHARRPRARPHTIGDDARGTGQRAVHDGITRASPRTGTHYPSRDALNVFFLLLSFLHFNFRGAGLKTRPPQGMIEKRDYATGVGIIALARRAAPSRMRSSAGQENDRRTRSWPLPSTQNALPMTNRTPCSIAFSSSATSSNPSGNCAHRKKPPFGLIHERRSPN